MQLPHADPAIARSIQGYLRALSATTLKHLCNTLTGPELSGDDKMNLIFDSFAPKLLKEKLESHTDAACANLMLLCTKAERVDHKSLTTSISRVRTEEAIGFELSKLDLLLMFFRTSTDFPMKLQLSSVRYLRWVIILAMELYPYLVMSPSQVQSHLKSLSAGKASKWSGSYGVTVDIEADGDNSYLTYFYKSIRLFLSDAPEGIGTKVDRLLVEIISHSHPLCELVGRQVFPIVYGRRSCQQNIDGFLQLYRVAASIDNRQIRTNIIKALGRNLQMLCGREQRDIIDSIIMSAKPDFITYDASSNLCQVEELKDYLTFFESIRWKLVLDSISHESLQVGKRNRTSFSEDFQAFVYNDLLQTCLMKWTPADQKFVHRLRCVRVVLCHFEKLGNAGDLHREVWHKILGLKSSFESQIANIEDACNTVKYHFCFEVIQEICLISRCEPLLAFANVDHHITPLLQMFSSILKKHIEMYDKYQTKAASHGDKGPDFNIELLLQQLKFVQSYVSVSLYELLFRTSQRVASDACFPWLRGLTSKKSSKSFAMSLRELVALLLYKCDIDQDNGMKDGESAASTATDFVLLELVSFVLRFDFGPFIKRQGPKFFLPESHVQVILDYLDCTGDGETSMRFSEIKVDIIHEEGQKLLAIVNRKIDNHPVDAVGPSNNDQNDSNVSRPLKIAPLEQGLKLIVNGLKIVNRHLTGAAASMVTADKDDANSGQREIISKRLSEIQQTIKRIEHQIM